MFETTRISYSKTKGCTKKSGGCFSSELSWWNTWLWQHNIDPPYHPPRISLWPKVAQMSEGSGNKKCPAADAKSNTVSAKALKAWNKNPTFLYSCMYTHAHANLQSTNRCALAPWLNPFLLPTPKSWEHVIAKVLQCRCMLVRLLYQRDAMGPQKLQCSSKDRMVAKAHVYLHPSTFICLQR